MASLMGWEGSRMSAWNADPFVGGKALVFLLCVFSCPHGWESQNFPNICSRVVLCREKSILVLLAVLLATYSHSRIYIKNTQSVNPAPVYILSLGCRSYMVITWQALKNSVYTVGFLRLTQHCSGREAYRKIMQDPVFQWLQICLPCI